MSNHEADLLTPGSNAADDVDERENVPSTTSADASPLTNIALAGTGQGARHSEISLSQFHSRHCSCINS